MRPPPLRTRVLGHPAVAGTLLLVGGATLFGAWRAGDAILIPAAIVAIALSRVLKASGWIAQYRAWKREWDGMAGTPSHPPRGPGWRVKATVGLLAITVACFLADPNHPVAAAAVLFFGMAGVLWLVVTLLRQLGKLVPAPGPGKRSDGAGPVAIVARPVLTVPSLPNAYSALPRHCRAVLRR